MAHPHMLVQKMHLTILLETASCGCVYMSMGFCFLPPLRMNDQKEIVFSS